MKKLTGLVVLTLISGLAFAQDLDTLSMDDLAVDTVLLDTINEPPPYYGGIYFMIGGRINPHYGGYNNALGLGIGAQYNKWIAAFSVVDFRGRIEDFLIFPNTFELDYRYGGPTFGYELLDSYWISWDMTVSYFFGDMVWRNMRNDEDFLRDKFSIMILSTKIDFDGIRYVKPYLKLGYQKTNNLDLTLVKPADFSGLVFVFGVQIGYFNQ